MKKRGRPKNHKLSQETKDRISRSMVGRKRTAEECNNISNGRKKAFEDKFALYNELLEEYKDSPEAIKWLEVNKYNIVENIPVVLTEKQLNNTKIKFIDVELMDTLSPEKLVMLFEEDE